MKPCASKRRTFGGLEGRSWNALHGNQLSPRCLHWLTRTCLEQMYRLKGGEIIIDTPGVRTFQPFGVKHEWVTSLELTCSLQKAWIVWHEDVSGALISKSAMAGKSHYSSYSDKLVVVPRQSPRFKYHRLVAVLRQGHQLKYNKLVVVQRQADRFCYAKNLKVVNSARRRACCEFLPEPHLPESRSNSCLSCATLSAFIWPQHCC